MASVKRRKAFRPPGDLPALAWIALGWALAFFSVLMLLNFHPIVKSELETMAPLGVVWPVFLLGLMTMVRGYRSIPSSPPKDIGRGAACIWLGLVLAAAAWMRLYQLGHAPGPFWDDWATIMIWVRSIVDKNRFYWMLPSDGIEPFVPYVIAGLQTILPDEVKDLTVRRLAACSIDLVALSILYLCGKELGSRRAGLVAAALGALGRPMIQLSLTGMRAYSLSLAISLLILASLRMFQKPTLGRFLFWGFALAFGIHTYSSFRVFMILLPFCLIPWALQEPGKGRIWTWLGMMASLFLLAGVYSGTFAGTYTGFSGWNALWSQWNEKPLWIASVFLAALGLCTKGVVSSWQKDRPSRLAGLALALGLACILIYPLTLSDQFTERLANLSPFRNTGGLLDIGRFLMTQVATTVRSLFFSCLDRNDLLIAADPFYDLFSQGALLLALAFFLARPDWKKGFLLLLSALGALVYIISIDPASTKLIGSAPGLYLLSGWAVSRLWAVFPPSRRPKTDREAGTVLTILLLLYAVWGGWIQNNKLFGYWAQIPMADTELARGVGEDEKTARVYLAPSPYFYGTNAQFILNEGRRYYLLRTRNLIPVKVGESPQDVVVFVYGPNATMIKTLRERFTTAQWEKRYVFPEVPGDQNPELYMWRVLIPGPEIARAKDPLFTPVEERGSWVKTFYEGFYGWGLGGILGEEWVETFSGTIPFETFGFAQHQGSAHEWLVRLQGPLNVPQTDNYEWTIDSPDATWFRIDGKTVFKKDVVGPPTLFHRKVHLSQGTHLTEIRMRGPDAYLSPRIEWRRHGEKEPLPF